MAPRVGDGFWCERHGTGKAPQGPVERKKSTPEIPLSLLKARAVAQGCEWTYFVREEFTRCVKIGRTTRPVSIRLSHLQTGCPSQLELLCAVFAPAWLEYRLHSLCAPWRRRGEWFDDCPRMDAVIEVYQRHDGKRIPRSLEDATKSAYSYEDLMV